MHTYARIVDGVVQEIIAPVVDSDGNEIPIADRFTAEFVSQLVDSTSVNPQPSCWWTYNGVSFSAPAAAQAPTPAQLAFEAVAAGLTISSAGTPALDGTYAIDQVSQMDIIAIETSLNAGKGFPGGATLFGFADMSGVMHSFTAASFTDFAAAVRDYVYALRAFVGGASETIPASTAAIS